MNGNNNNLAALFINEQPYLPLYSLPEALAFGTLFPPLNMPYVKPGK